MRPASIFRGLAGIAFGSLALVSGSLPTLAQSAPSDLPVLLQDDFKDKNSGWLTVSATPPGEPRDSKNYVYSLGYATAGYFIYDNQPNDTRFASNLSLDKMGLADETVEVDATKGAGVDASTGYGVACRLKGSTLFPEDSPISAYALIVTGDGQAGLAKVMKGQFSSLQDLAPNAAVNGGNASNHLELDCVGSNITAYVNGQVIASVQDDTLASGGVGFWAGTQQDKGAGIVYNNAVVRSAGGQ